MTWPALGTLQSPKAELRVRLSAGLCAMICLFWSRAPQFRNEVSSFAIWEQSFGIPVKNLLTLEYPREAMEIAGIGSMSGMCREVRNILVVSETFLGGGLETQLVGQARYLAGRGIRMHLATASSRNPLADEVFASSLYDLSMNRGPEDVRDMVARLGAFVDEHEVDVVHAHPFLSLLIGMIVAHQKRLPLVATLHGPASVSVGDDTIFDLLFQKALLPEASLQFAVSEEVVFLAKSMGDCDPEVLPNAVDVPSRPAPAPDPGLPWLWAGRLDSFKLPGLRCLIAEVLRRKSHALHIYGDGPATDELRQYLSQADPEGRWIAMGGWDDRLAEHMANYSLVAGMGRVLLEGAAASRPCMLVGYDGIKGLLTPKEMAEAARWNFSGRGLLNEGSEELDQQLQALQHQPERFMLYDWVRTHRSAAAIWETYLSRLQSLKPFSSKLVDDLTKCLLFAGTSGVSVWSDYRMFRVLRNLLKARTRQAS